MNVTDPIWNDQFLHGQKPAAPAGAAARERKHGSFFFYLHKKTPRRCSSSRSPARCSRCNTARPRCDRCSRCRPQAARALRDAPTIGTCASNPKYSRISGFKRERGGLTSPDPPCASPGVITPEKAPRRCTRSRSPARRSRCNTARPRCDRRPRRRPHAARASRCSDNSSLQNM